MYEPLYRHRPSARWTYGDLACKVGADLGLPPDAEQQWILDATFAEKAPSRPASFEVVAISPRQNIKTSTFGIAALTDLFVFEVRRHLWTAHHGDTLKGTFQDFQGWIRSNPEYEDQVDFYEGHQDMAIVHRETGGRIEFQSRGGTGKFGRGLTGVERVTMDEALYLEAKHIGAVYPTMLTRPEAQVRIASSAGLIISETLRDVRDKGRAGKNDRMTYIEYGAVRRPCGTKECLHVVGTPGCVYDVRALWWEANCALWSGRITEEALENQRTSMPPAEWAREFFSWWEDPESVGGALSSEAWKALADQDAERGTGVIFGVDVTEDRSAWVAVAWLREDGHRQVQLVDDVARPAFGLVARCVELAARWNGAFAVPKALAKEFMDAGLQVVEISSADFTSASGSFADDFKASVLRHGNQEALNDAVKAAKWGRSGTGGERGFQLAGCPEVGPLAAAVRALQGVRNNMGDEVLVW